MRLIPIRQYNKATATVALLLCMASSFSPLRVSADQYSRYLAEDGSEQVTALDSGTEQVTALATDSQQVAASESGGKEITATELASDEIKATGVEVTDLEIDEAATQADGLEEEVAATDYIYIIEDPHMSMSTDPPVLPPTYGKGSVEGYYYYHHAKGKGGSMKSKSKSKSKSKKHKSSAYYDDEYYVDPDYSKGKGKGKGAFYDDEYYHVETTAPKTHIPTDMPAHSEDSSVDEPDPSVPPEEEDQASQLPTTLPSTVNGEGHYVEYGYKVGKHKKSHEYYYTEPEYVYHEPEEPEYVEEIPKYVFQKPIYHYPVYPSKSMKSHKMKSTKTYYSVGEVPTSKGKGYYPAAPTAAKGKGKGYYPSPTSPATKHTPAPDGSKKASRSPVPPSSPSPASIPQQSIPGKYILKNVATLSIEGNKTKLLTIALPFALLFTRRNKCQHE